MEQNNTKKNGRKKKEIEEGGEGEGGSGGGRERKGRQRSKLEQKMLTDVMDDLKQSIVRKQVVAGREFKVHIQLLTFVRFLKNIIWR